MSCRGGALAMWMAICASHGLCHAQRVAENYESFFSQVAEAKGGDAFHPPPPAPPFVLTEQESASLRTIAVRCVARMRELKEAIRTARLELVLQSTEGVEEQKLRRQFDMLQAQYTQAAAEHIDLVKTAFGPNRFALMEPFLRWWTPGKGSPFAEYVEPPRAVRSGVKK